MAMHGFSSLRVRMLLLILLPVIPALVFILYDAVEQFEQDERQAKTDMMAFARYVAFDEQQLVDETRQFLATLSHLDATRDAGKCLSLLSDLHRYYPHYANVGVTDRAGNVYCSAVPLSGGTVNIATQEYIRRSMSTGNFVTSDYHVGRITGKRQLNFAYPLLDPDKKPIGAVFAAVEASWFQDVAGRVSLPDGMTLVVADRNGVIIGRIPNGSDWVGKPLPETQELRRHLAGKSHASGEFVGIDGKPRYFVVKRLAVAQGEENDILVSVVANADAISAKGRKVLTRNLAALGGVTLLVLILAWYGAQIAFLRKVRALIGTTQRVAGGDFSARSEIAPGPGEIRKLAATFDRMAETLGKMAQRNELILECAGEGIYGVDEHGHTTFINRKALEMLDYEHDELIGQSIHDLIHHTKSDGSYYPRCDCPVHGALHGGAYAFNVEEVFWRKDGSNFPVEYSSAPIYDQGNIVGAVCVFRDASGRKAIERRVAEFQGRLIRAQEIAHLGNWEWNLETNVWWWSAEVFAILDLDSNAAVVGFDAFMERVHPDDQDRVSQAISTAILEPMAYAIEHRVVHRDGSIHFVSQVGECIRGEAGGPKLLESTIADITARKRAEDERDRLVEILEATPDFVCLADLDCRPLYLNRAGRALVGLGENDDLSKLSPEVFFAPWALEIIRSEGIPSASRDGLWGGETALRSPEGGEIPVSQVIISHTDADGREIYRSSIARNITDRKQMEMKLLHQATHDDLTGLPNRVLFMDRLEQAFVHAQRHSRLVAVIFLDLDNFKNVNDALGHAKGDCVIRSAAQRLTDVLRKDDTVARFGGDEFVLLLQDIANVENIVGVAEKALHVMSQPFLVDGYEIYASASMGITLYPFDDETPEDLLKNADTAMYRAKRQGRNNFQFYTAEMNDKMHERMKIESALRHAIERNQLLLHYQPKVDLKSGEICGMEALLRWEHPEFGLVSPDKFIPIAEETGLIIPIGEWVLRTACEQTKAWRDAGFHGIQVAVNLSARQFKQRDLIQRVRQVLAVTGLAPEYLELEITESAVMQDKNVGVATLHELRSMDVRIAIDDFGTGYSSLSYLKIFPIDNLKIDRSFVRDVTTDRNNAAIAKAIVAMSHSLGLRVVAEGVETKEQLEFLHALRCDEIQGYYFSRPLPADKFLDLLITGQKIDLKESPAMLCVVGQ